MSERYTKTEWAELFERYGECDTSNIPCWNCPNWFNGCKETFFERDKEEDDTYLRTEKTKKAGNYFYKKILIEEIVNDK